MTVILNLPLSVKPKNAMTINSSIYNERMQAAGHFGQLLVFDEENISKGETI